MQYKRLGKTGLVVSRLGLGSLTFGSEVDEKSAIEIVAAAHDLGINLFDTGDIYPVVKGRFGLSEKILGEAVKSFRQDVILSTKIGYKNGVGMNDEGLSRAHIMKAVDNSLRRLQTDYIDLYQAHIWDPETPIEETLRAFDDLVRSGKVRYIGCSNWDSWQICKSLWISDARNLTRFESVQARYNLITRQIETELMPFCMSESVGLLVWNPLAGGLLTGGIYDAGGKLVTSYKKGETPKTGRFASVRYRDRYWYDRNLDSVEKVRNIAKARGNAPVQISLAWVLSNPAVTTALVGVDFIDQLAQNVAAVDISLTAEEISVCNDIWDTALPPGWSLQMGGDALPVQVGIAKEWDKDPKKI